VDAATMQPWMRGWDIHIVSAGAPAGPLGTV
jgi:hypothetical protein